LTGNKLVAVGTQNENKPQISLYQLAVHSELSESSALLSKHSKLFSHQMTAIQWLSSRLGSEKLVRQVV